MIGTFNHSFRLYSGGRCSGSTIRADCNTTTRHLLFARPSNNGKASLDKRGRDILEHHLQTVTLKY